MITFDDSISGKNLSAKIKVLGVGGAGNNTVNSMIRQEYDSNIEFIVANTDAQALEASTAKNKIQLGIKLTKGLGSGANPEIGKRAAEEDLDKILEVIDGADIVFLAGGMGGGTGSGALPVIAKALREHNILTIAIVTKPFTFEGKRRDKVATEAIKNLQHIVDTLIVIPNQKLLDVAGESIPMIEAFEMINDILYQSVKGISYIITRSGHINVDFADLRVIMKDMGCAVMGTGRASGNNRAINATREAISSPLLENMNINGAKGVLINISGGPSLSLQEIHEAASVIYEQADEQANIILGSVIDQNMNDDVIVTVIATGCQPQIQDEEPKTIAIELQEETIATLEKEEIKEEISIKASTRDRKSEESKIITQYINHEPIDLSDIDVPTFLRQEVEDDENKVQE